MCGDGGGKGSDGACKGLGLGSCMGYKGRRDCIASGEQDRDCGEGGRLGRLGLAEQLTVAVERLKGSELGLRDSIIREKERRWEARGKRCYWWEKWS